MVEGFLFFCSVVYFLLLCVGETGETPVRARRREACCILFSTGVPQLPGQAIGDFREGEKGNAESKYPDITSLCKFCRECRRFGGGNTFKKGENDMQRKKKSNLVSRILCMMLIVAMALFTIGCNKADEKETSSGNEAKVTAPADNTQDDASGDEDADQAGDAASGVTELGEGALSFNFSVVDKDENETKFVIHTDKTTVGAALLEHGLIEGDEGDYGLYVKKVNGILADYDVDMTYWALYINGEYATSGVDTTNVTEGDSYTFKVVK